MFSFSPSGIHSPIINVFSASLHFFTLPQFPILKKNFLICTISRIARNEIKTHFQPSCKRTYRGYSSVLPPPTAAAPGSCGSSPWWTCQPPQDGTAIPSLTSAKARSRTLNFELCSAKHALTPTALNMRRYVLKEMTDELWAQSQETQSWWHKCWEPRRLSVLC